MALRICTRRRRNADPYVVYNHPIFSADLMRMFRSEPNGHSKPEAWLAERKAANQAPGVRVFKPFLVTVYTRPNKGGRAVVPVDPNLSDPIGALAYHVATASGLSPRFLLLKINNETLSKKAQLDALRQAPPYSLQVIQATSSRNAIEVPREPPVAAPVQAAALYVNSSTTSAAAAVPTPSKNLADVFTVRDGDVDNTALAALTRNIAQNFGQRMQESAKSANLPPNALLNARHVAHANAHQAVQDPEVYRRTLTESGMSEADAAKVSPDAFWDELAQLSASDAADDIGKSIADSIAAMPNSAVGANPERLYATKAAGSHIFRNWGERLRYLLTGQRPGPYWAYRIGPSYTAYHYEPDVIVPATRYYPTVPLPYGYPRRGRGRRWLMMKPFRMAVANTDEADAQIAAQAQIETTQAARQDALAAHLINARSAGAELDVTINAAAKVDVFTSVPAAADIDVTIKAARKIDVAMSVALDAAADASSMPGLVMCAGDASSMPGLVMCAGDASSMPGLVMCAGDSSSMPSLVPLPKRTMAAAAAAAPADDAMSFEVPSMCEIPAASPMVSLMAPDTLGPMLPKLNRSMLNSLSTELLAAANSELPHSCAMILPEIKRDGTYKAIMNKLSSKNTTDRRNVAKSISDYYTISGTGHADQLATFLAGNSNSVQLNSNVLGSFWRLSRAPGGSLQLQNSKGTTSYAAAYQHDAMPHVVVFTVDIHHHK